MDWLEHCKNAYAFCKKEVAWNEKYLESIERDIAWDNKMIKSERKKDRELCEYIWGKGVLDKWQMKIYGDPKKYVGSETKTYIGYRAQEYRRRKMAEKWLANAYNDLAFYKAELKRMGVETDDEEV